MPRQLTLSHFSMRHASFSERVAAAELAGFDGIGLYVGAFEKHTRAVGFDAAVEEMQIELEAHRMAITELEALPLFRDDLTDSFAYVVEAFDVQRVQVIPPFVGEVDRASAAAWLRIAADRLAPARLAIEFLPPTDLADAVETVDLVEQTCHPHVGICVDSWHVFRGAGLDSLRNLDPRHVVSVQIDDGPIVPVLDDYIADCLHYRVPPGEGEFDLSAFLALLPANAPMSVEVIDDDLDLLAPALVASLLMASLQPLLNT